MKIENVAKAEDLIEKLTAVNKLCNICKDSFKITLTNGSGILDEKSLRVYNLHAEPYKTFSANLLKSLEELRDSIEKEIQEL